MITNLDIEDKVYTILRTAGISNMFKGAKPVNESKPSYVVINTLPLSSDVLQECPFNVNVHLQDIDAAKRIPNRPALAVLTEDIIDTIGEYTDGDIDITLVTQAGPIQEVDVPEHYINLRFILRHTRQ